MASFFIVLICFLVSFALHILVHRYYRVRIANVVAAYAIGAVLLYGFGRMGYINLPWSSGFLYVLLSSVIIVFYITISLGTEIPTSIILASFKREKRQTFSDLTALFTDNGLIFSRIDDLIQSKLVERSGSRLRLTPRGKLVWHVLEVYRRVFHRTLTE
jgi:hypothetical protein